MNPNAQVRLEELAKMYEAAMADMNEFRQYAMDTMDFKQSIIDTIAKRHNDLAGIQDQPQEPSMTEEQARQDVENMSEPSYGEPIIEPIVVEPVKSTKKAK